MDSQVKQQYILIINEYKNKINNFNDQLQNTPYKCVFNNQLIDNKLLSKETKAIIVMDNPGIDELKYNEYLIGKAGKGFNKVIASLSTSEDSISRENLLIFNKSALHTGATNDLVKIYEDENLSQIFLEEQKITFETIHKIHQLLQIPLMIHGYSSYFKADKKFIENNRGNRPLYIFFKMLFENYNLSALKDLVYFYHHSSYGCLEKQLREYESEREQRNFKIYKQLGKYNLSGFFD